MAEAPPLEPGLYVVSTPIGAARDITLRALDVLTAAGAIAAEDTRVTRKLLEMHGIPLGGRPLIPYHEHNAGRQRPKILAMIREGAAVAHVSDAGTPLVADPGFVLAKDAAAAGFAVRAVPGPSALLAALVVSGLPSDRFLFAGFLPATGAARRRVLAELQGVPATLVFFETGRRLSASLKDLVSELGGEREAAVCRELTKRFEETRRATLAELARDYDRETPKGEIVVLVDRARTRAAPETRDEMLREALETMSVKDAARHVSEALSLPRREVYQAALELAARP